MDSTTNSSQMLAKASIAANILDLYYGRQSDRLRAMADMKHLDERKEALLQYAGGLEDEQYHAMVAFTDATGLKTTDISEDYRELVNFEDRREAVLVALLKKRDGKPLNVTTGTVSAMTVNNTHDLNALGVLEAQEGVDAIPTDEREPVKITLEEVIGDLDRVSLRVHVGDKVLTQVVSHRSEVEEAMRTGNNHYFRSLVAQAQEQAPNVRFYDGPRSIEFAQEAVQQEQEEMMAPEGWSGYKNGWCGAERDDETQCDRRAGHKAEGTKHRSHGPRGVKTVFWGPGKEY